MPSIKPIFGGAIMGTMPGFATEAETLDVFDRLENGGCMHLDISSDFPHSEPWMGKMKASERFRLDSKTAGGIVPGTSTRSGILRDTKNLAELVGQEHVDVYYLHAPDATLELEDMLAGINDSYRAGYFRRFGLSNYTAEEVEQVYNICKEKGYPLPAVYQGNYNPVARKLETTLFPTLRRLGMSFYAYSPMAGGFLTKTPEQITARSADAGRFGGETLFADMYNTLYNKPSYLRALQMWRDTAQAAGISPAEMANRWVACDSALRNSCGDAILFGAGRPSHVSDTLEWLKKGSLGADTRARIEEIWRVVEADAPVDNYQSFFKGQESRLNASNPRES